MPDCMPDRAPDRAEMLLQLATERYSCRGFLPEALPRATIDRILTIAQRSASWCNSQPWQITVGSAAATQRARAALLAYVRQAGAPKPDLDWPLEYRNVYLQRRRECGLQLYRATGVARGDTEAAERQRLENFRFFGAPHVAVVTTEAPLGTYGAIDCGAYVGLFMLAARACGVASIALAALGAYPAFWREHWGLDPGRRVVCGLAFGHEDGAHPANGFRTSRATIDEAVHWID
jgi:nitroreductase